MQRCNINPDMKLFKELTKNTLGLFSIWNNAESGTKAKDVLYGKYKQALRMENDFHLMIEKRKA